MSSRPLIKQHTLLSGSSMGADVTSDPIIISQLPAISFDLSWTGSPTGTFSVEVSNTVTINPDGTPKASTGNWNTLTLSSTISASGSAGNGFIDIGETGAFAIRLKYTRTSGTGSLTAVVQSKVL